MIEKIGHYSMSNPASVIDEEALTALELAGRTAAKVNECVEEVNKIPENITNEVQEQIDNGTFEAQIDKHNKVMLDHIIETENQMAADLQQAKTQMGNDLAETEATLGSRLDNLLGAVTEGSTSGDAELIDMRTDVDGNAFASAGVAVRNQVKRFNETAVGLTGHINFDKSSRKFTLEPILATQTGVLFSIGTPSTTNITSYVNNLTIPLENVDELSTFAAVTYLVLNKINLTLKTVDSRTYVKAAGDIILCGAYTSVAWCVGLSAESFYIDGNPRFVNIAPKMRETVITEKPFIINMLDDTITMQAGWMFKANCAYDDVDKYAYQVYSPKNTAKTIPLNTSGTLQHVCFNIETRELEIVDRNHIFSGGERCLISYLNSAYIPVELNPACLEMVYPDNESAINENVYRSVQDMISQIGRTDRVTKIVLGGDSITHGNGGSGYDQSGELILDGGGRQWYRNPDGYCWANLFKDYVETNYNATVTVNACSGTNTSTWWANRTKLIPADTDIFIFMIGTNNRAKSVWDTRDGALSAYYNELSAIVDYCHANGTTVILMSPIPATAENDADTETYSCTTAQINTQTMRVAAAHGMGYINMYNAIFYHIYENGLDYADYMSDELHPNDAGYKLIFDKLLKEMGLAHPHETN